MRSLPELKIETVWNAAEPFFGFHDKSQYRWGHLKRLGTQVWYPIKVFIWVVAEVNEKTFFRPTLANGRGFNSFVNLPFTLLSLFIKRLLFF